MGVIKKISRLLVVCIWLLPLAVSAQTPVASSDLTALSQSLQTIEQHIKQNTTARLVGQDLFADPALEQTFIDAFGTLAVQKFSLFCPVPTTVATDNTVRLDCVFTLYGVNAGTTLSFDPVPTYFILSPGGTGWQVIETDLSTTVDGFPAFDMDFFMTDFWNIFLKMFFWIWLLNLPVIAFVIWMMIDAWKRDPENRVMWLVMMIFLGYLAAFIYYFSTRRKKIAEQHSQAQAKKSVYLGIGLVVVMLGIFFISPYFVVRVIMKDFFPNFSTLTDKSRYADQSQPNLLDYAPAKTTPTDTADVVDAVSDETTDYTLQLYGDLDFTYDQLQSTFIERGYIFEELLSSAKDPTVMYMGTLTASQSSLLADVSSETNMVTDVSIDFTLPKNEKKQTEQINIMVALLTLAGADGFDQAWLEQQYQSGADSNEEYIIEQTVDKKTVVFTYDKYYDIVAIEVRGPELQRSHWQSL